MRLDNENRLKRRRRLIEPIADAFCGRSSSSLGLLKASGRIALAAQTPLGLGQLPLTGPLGTRASKRPAKAMTEMLDDSKGDAHSGGDYVRHNATDECSSACSHASHCDGSHLRDDSPNSWLLDF
jgi:hypothetical protein